LSSDSARPHRLCDGCNCARPPFFGLRATKATSRSPCPNVVCRCLPSASHLERGTPEPPRRRSIRKDSSSSSFPRLENEQPTIHAASAPRKLYRRGFSALNYQRQSRGSTGSPTRTRPGSTTEP
jgi:hypothetical protein